MAWPLVPRTTPSVQAGDLELITHGMAQGGLAAIGQRQRRAVGRVQGEEIDAGRDALDGWEHLLGLVGRHDLDVGDLAPTQLGELAHAHGRLHHRWRGELAFATAAGLGRLCIVVVFHDAHSFLSGALARPGRGRRQLAPAPINAPHLPFLPAHRVRALKRTPQSFVAPPRSTFRTRRSRSRPPRAMHNRPALRSADLTSMPSARTNERLNCRAAIPRCRNSRALSSSWRPRITSWLSSTVISSWSRRKPATANVMRRRSVRSAPTPSAPAPLALMIRSML